MNIRLFPSQFLEKDACFRLFRPGDETALDLPITIEGNSGVPFHIVHSDPDHLAFLAGLLVLQAWVYGIDELGIPPSLPGVPTTRRPLLIVTDSPGRLGDAYLKLHMPAASIREVSNQRQKHLYKKLGLATNAAVRCEQWNLHIKPDETRTRLHNFFPACYVMNADAPATPIASRENIGRGDDSGPAVLITRNLTKNGLAELQRRFRPFLVLFDAHGGVIPASGDGTPAVVYHRSIFATELTGPGDDLVLCCLPDARFERFCSEATLRVIEPDEPDSLAKTWSEVDSALQALTERLDHYRSRLLVEVHRASSRIRSTLLSLPVGISCYEQALRLSGQPEELWYPCSITQPLQALESRVPELGALGEWEEFVLSELVAGFRQLEEHLRDYSPKREAVLAAIQESLTRQKRVALVVTGLSLAEGLKWALRLPEPFGLGMAEDRVSAVTTGDVGGLGDDQDCIVHHAFEPGDIFSSLSRISPRQITYVLLRNELRFVGERFLRMRQLLLGHPAHGSILSPIYRQVERLAPLHPLSRREPNSTLSPDVDFQLVLRTFEEPTRTPACGMVLLDDASDGDAENLAPEVLAHLVTLEGNLAVFLEPGSRVTFIRNGNVISAGRADFLEPGHQLISISPEAREFIAHRVISAKRAEERENVPSQIIKQWQRELTIGVERRGLMQSELLRRCRGSVRYAPPRGSSGSGPQEKLSVPSTRRISGESGRFSARPGWSRTGSVSAPPCCLFEAVTACSADGSPGSSRGPRWETSNSRRRMRNSSTNLISRSGNSRMP